MKTKIVCTLGPSSNSEEKLREMIAAGMNVARVNCSHESTKQREILIRLIKKLRAELGVDLKIMLDTRGPEIRVGRFGDTHEKTGQNGFVDLTDGQIFTFHTKPVVGDTKGVYVTYDRLPKVVKIGQEVLLNDGLIVMTVESVTADTVVARVKNAGRLSDRKTMFVPGCDLGLPFISPEDAEDIAMGCREGMDWIALSFVNSEKDLAEIKEFLKQNGREDVVLISKIESLMGVNNLDSILKNTDGVMVARGDLGVEFPYEKIPALQKDIIARTRNAKKIIIAATEMHESMIEKARPTRAETTDVANAIWDGSDYIMTSAETAVGKYPIQTVQSMLKIARDAEEHKKYFRM